MNYYTSTISVTLAEKLKEKGMPIEKEGENTWCPSYAEVLDWLMNRGIELGIEPHEKAVKKPVWGKYNFWVINTIANTAVLCIDGLEWHEAAEKAIENALTLI